MATFGTTSIGSFNDTLSADSKTAYRVVLGEDASVSKLTGYVSGQGPGVGDQKAKAFIYADNAGVPGALLGVSNEVTIVQGAAYAWVDFVFASPVQINAGTYWLGYIGSAPNDGSEIKSGTGSAIRAKPDTYSDGPSDPYGAATTFNLDPYSLYATYTPYVPPPPPPAARYFKGVATGYILNLSDTQIQRIMNEVASIGAQQVRFDLNPVIWAKTQTAINFAIAAGLNCYMGYNSSHVTATMQGYLDFMVPWLRDRGQHYWEFINEPNGNWGGWGGNPDAAAYTAALKVFTPYVKAMDPAAYIICGALSTAPDNPPTSYSISTFFDAMITAGLAAADFDAVSMHPYSDPELTLSWQPYRHTWGTAPSVRTSMDAKGPTWQAKPIWISETGQAAPWDVPTVTARVGLTYDFMKRTDLGPMGGTFFYSAEQTDSWSVMFPGGVRNAYADAFANVVIPTGTYDSEVLIDNPLLYLKLDESSGGFTDSSGHTHPGTQHGGITYDATGLATGSAITLNGTTGYVTVVDHADFDTGDSFALEIWVKGIPSTPGGTMALFDKGTNSYRLEIDTNRTIALWCLGVGKIIQTTVQVPADANVHHIVAEKAGATVKVYLDKVDITANLTNQTVANNASNIGIGAQPGGGLYLSATVEKAAIYAAPLGQTRVTQHYNIAKGLSIISNDLTVNYNVATRVQADLSPVYNIAVSGAPIQVAANLTAAYDIIGKIRTDLVVIYDIASRSFTPASSTVVDPQPLPTDLETFADRLYDQFEPLR